jgi:ABC-type ATPase involved in cell division
MLSDDIFSIFLLLENFTHKKSISDTTLIFISDLFITGTEGSGKSTFIRQMQA